MQYHIFLSYSRKNLNTMQRVRDDLRATGLRVWTDEGIEPGSISWKEAIEQAIREAGMIVVLLSPSANDSRWVQREIDYAETLNKPIVPLLIKGSEQEAIPFALAGSQFIDVRTNYETRFDNLLHKCFEHMPSADMPTVQARSAATTVMSGRERNRQRTRQRSQWMFVLTVIVLVFALGMGGLSMGGFFDIQADDSMMGELHILYNRDTLVIHNTSSETIDLTDWQFELNGQNIQFSANDWLTQALPSGRCVQVWDVAHGYLSVNAPPANVCDSRVAYRATSEPFWVSNNARIRFSVTHNNQTIVTCPVVTRTSTDTLRCDMASSAVE
ncbi:MAG: toll/interleukin-1 receptor domain-containing protein [Chloroflexota bacterium]